MTREEKERIQQKLHRAADAHLNAYGGNLYYEGVARGLEQAAGIVGKTKCKEGPRWISTSEKLPTDRDWCLGVFKEKSTGWVCDIPFVCEYLGRETSSTTTEGWIIQHCTDEPNKFGGDFFKELTCVAWMPLPEPYAEKEENDGSD